MQRSFMTASGIHRCVRHLMHLLRNTKTVTGTVKVKLYKGNHVVVARKSPVSLYNEELATYSKNDLFDHSAAVGFIKLLDCRRKYIRKSMRKKK